MTDPARKDATTPPSGSARAAVEAPTDRKSRKWLWIAVAAVAGLLLILWLIPTAAEAVPLTVIAPDLSIADIDDVLGGGA
ncbi:MAG: hypothetical protein AAF390_09075 [Pseudomonadota bacterium]